MRARSHCLAAAVAAAVDRCPPLLPCLQMVTITTMELWAEKGPGRKRPKAHLGSYSEVSLRQIEKRSLDSALDLALQ